MIPNSPEAEEQKVHYIYVFDALAAGVLILISIAAPIPWWWIAGGWVWFLGTR